MSPAENKAVFLSYASQDAEAAKCIAEALRASGVEVWFDVEGGLETGDAWDAKIRGQIKECVLFIPIVSANTQARHEGYFRIEWELAAQRAMGIASGVPFILPVVIDDTREPDALVPDRFRMVQWTKLRAGEVPPEVQQRFLKLWSHRTGLLKSKLPAGPSPESQSPAQASPKARWPLALGIGAVVVAVVFGGFLAIRPSVPSVSPPAVSIPKAPPPQMALSKRYASSRPDVATLLTRVQAMTDKTDVARAELEAALGLLDQAAKLDASDANILAERALVELRYVTEHFDFTPARKNAALQHAKQAVSLDPKNPNARLADAFTQWDAAFDNASGAAVAAILEPLVAENTDRFEAYLILASWRMINRRKDEAFTLLDRAAQLPGTAGRAAFWKAQYLFGSGDYNKVNETLDHALALERSAHALLYKSYVATFWLGDIDLAKQAIDGIPGGMLTEDFPASGKLYVALWGRNWDTAITTMRAFPRNYLEPGALPGPTGYYIGYALDRAGRKSAAEIEWRSALEVVNQRPENSLRRVDLFQMKTLLLAALGDRPGAEKALQTLRELYPKAWDGGWAGHMVAMNLLPPEQAIDLLEKQSQRGSEIGMSGNLKLDPFLDHLRSHPKFAALLAKAAADPKRNPAAVPRPTVESAAASPTPDPKSVAVLAFANLSDDKANEYFSDGISDELLTVLQKIPGLRVAARTSAFSFKGKNATAKEVGERLSMAHIVEGSVQKSGNRVKITARLSRAATNEEIWSESYGPLELTDVFATQSEIAQKIVAKLRSQLTGETATPAAAAAAAQAEIKAQVQAATKGGTKNPEAHQLYLQGRYLATRSRSADVARGIDYYEQALKLDPNFAVAWAALARARLWQLSWEPVNPERAQQARTAAARALALDADMADAHSVLSQIMLRYSYEWRAAKEGSARALMLAPTDAAILTDAAATEQALGTLERSVELARRALALDPVSVDARFYLALSYQFMDRLVEAEDETRRMIDLSSNGIFAHGMLSAILLMQGRAKEALAEAQLEPEKMYRLQSLAAAHFALGQERESDAALEAMMRDFKEVGPYPIAWVYAVRKDRDKAFEWLERAYQLHDAGISWLRADNLLKPLHTDPRWPVLLRKIGLADDQLK